MNGNRENSKKKELKTVRPKRIHIPPPKPPLTFDRHKTSDQNGFFLFLGSINSGKSSTINFLFGQREISPVYKTEAGGKILEFTTINSTQESNLRIIDTPGLGASLERDSKIIGTLKKYLDRDPELRLHIPQCIILVMRFDDEKIILPNSSFTRTLRAIDLLNNRLLSKSYSNLIILLTHTMSGRTKAKENPLEKYKTIMSIVKRNLRIVQKPYIILADNEAIDWGLSQEREKGNFKLPNGDCYPKNLIEHLIGICATSKSSNECFNFIRDTLENRKKVDLKLKSCLSLVDNSSSRYQRAEDSLRIVYEKF